MMTTKTIPQRLTFTLFYYTTYHLVQQQLQSAHIHSSLLPSCTSMERSPREIRLVLAIRHVRCRQTRLFHRFLCSEQLDNQERYVDFLQVRCCYSCKKKIILIIILSNIRLGRNEESNREKTEKKKRKKNKQRSTTKSNISCFKREFFFLLLLLLLLFSLSLALAFFFHSSLMSHRESTVFQLKMKQKKSNHFALLIEHGKYSHFQKKECSTAEKRNIHLINTFRLDG